MKEFLSLNGVKYVERDVSVDRAAATEMVARSGQRGVPVTVIDGEVVVGFDRPRLEQIIRSRSSQRLALGISVADARSRAEQGGPVASQGAYVGRVSSGSLGERLGLKPGDVIVDINGQPIRSAADVEAAMVGVCRGEVLRVTFNRVDQWLTREATV